MKNSLFLLLLLSPLNGVAGDVQKKAKTLYMKDTDVASVKVMLGQSTILNFPTRPIKIVMGNKNHFAVEYIESDVVISALQPQAHCNLVVYAQGRRFSFDLTTSATSGDEIVQVRDGYLKPRKKNPKWNLKQKSVTQK